MKKNSWKTLLSVVLLLTMLVSMLPSAAFAEDGQTAATPTEEAAKTEDVPKADENTGDTPKADDETPGAAKDESTGDTEQPTEGEAEDAAAQAEAAPKTVDIPLTYDAPTWISILYYPGYDSTETVVLERADIGKSYTVKGSNTFNPPHGKHFVNWNTEWDGSGTTYEAGQEITAPGDNLILVAQWADNPK